MEICRGSSKIVEFWTNCGYMPHGHNFLLVLQRSKFNERLAS